MPAHYARAELARISHTVTGEGYWGSVGAEFLPREQVEQEQAALRPCFSGGQSSGNRCLSELFGPAAQ